jgi:hypothetical protein
MPVQDVGQFWTVELSVLSGHIPELITRAVPSSHSSMLRVDFDRPAEKYESTYEG